MNNYELTIVLDAKAGAPKKKKVVESIEKLAKIVKEKDWGVKELAYKIGKSESGLYLFFEVEVDPKSVKALNEKLRTDADILRFLLIKKD
ncbi:MAG TPA: 30S ribosomal protein S6 [Alphaproteobacteria bacterium]|jgi:small subunit ribosomal protein S6|nr:30S ribosomal protein S6 [Alphaproteobacteria bacterium]